MTDSLYIHIPFCRRKCLYCDFYSVIYDKDLAREYADAVALQIMRLEGRFSTIYIGGGTPSVMETDSLNKLLKAIDKVRTVNSEFTIEINPESATEDKIKLFFDSGVNRLSIGVQSLNDKKLKSLGRLHGAKEAVASIERSKRAGFKNISMDLIFGLWNESLKDWEDEVKRAARLPVTHISCYSLSYEKNTPLFLALSNKSLCLIEDDISAAMYESSIDALSLNGFKQYEVSNFAEAGFECRHNLNYWENGPYTGIGASAVSYIDGRREKNTSDVAEYIKRMRCPGSIIESSEKLSPLRRAKETAAVKIRTKEGIDFARFLERTGFDFMKLEGRIVEKLLAEELIKYVKRENIPVGIALKRKGFLHCDTVSSAFL